mgnify:CR=1 FL=1
MSIFLILAIIVLLALGILGAVVKGLLWLTLIAVIVFVIGGVVGYFRFKGTSTA